jgi:hypothetical protein
MGPPPPAERRFDDEEVAEILARATQPDRGADGPPSANRGGLTLAELQSIGAEVGIAPERIAAAAREIRLRAATPPPIRFLGAPASAAYIVPLPGPLDDAAWDRLVAHLRSTFAAQGRVSRSGSIRSWRNGNLQAHVEPDPDAPEGASGASWRLRMQTRKGSARLGSAFGTFAIPFGLFMVLVSVLGVANPQSFLVGAGFVLGGFGHLGYLRATLSEWARTRQSQMEQIAAGVRHDAES